MDSMLKRRVNSFARDFGYDGLDDGAMFERYAAYTFLYRYMNESSDSVDAVVTGGGNDLGIDIAAVIVNGVLMREPSEIETVIQGEGSSRAKVIFAQVKTSSRQDSKMIAKFLSGVLHVTKAGVEPDSNISLTGKLRDVADMLDVLVENQEKFEGMSFPLDLYYITTSEQCSTQPLEELQVQNAVADIERLKVYENVVVQLLGRQDIDAKLQNSRRPQNVPFNFKDKVVVEGPEEDSARLDKAYIGNLPISELLKLLLTSVDASGELRGRIFDDNVRQFMGDGNLVNKKIYGTLNGSERSLFPIFNNGVTIIASELNESSYRMKISGYQVVNGAQTCSQIVRWFQDGASEEQIKTTYVPVKIIVSKDLDLRSQVTVATNLQTPIVATDIQSSSQKAKDVEEYFENSGDLGLRYQRQAAEDEPDFIKVRVFTTDMINRAVAAAIFGDASQAVRSPRSLAGESSIIWLDHPVELYFLSAWILYQVDSHFRRSSEDNSLRAAKYHVVSLVASELFPELRDVHNAVNNDEKLKALRRVQNRVVQSIQPSADDIDGGYMEGLTDKIRCLIVNACVAVRTRFDEVVCPAGLARSLRKDDVRHLSLYSELRDVLESLG